MSIDGSPHFCQWSYRLRTLIRTCGRSWLLLFFTLMSPLPAEEVVVGVVLSLTGAGSTYSRDGLEGLQVAVDELNDGGGLLAKHPIRLVVVDDATKADVATARTAEMLATANPAVVIGTYSSACALAIKPLLAQARVLHLSPIANAERIAFGDSDGWSFLLGPSTHMQARAGALGIARLAVSKGWKTYATMASDYEFGRATQSSFVASLRQAAPSLELVQELWPRLGEPRFEPFIAQLAGAHPDFVYTVLASDDNRKWVTTAPGVDFFSRFPCPGSLISVSELQAQRDMLPRGMIAVTRAPFFAHPDEPRMQRFVAAFSTRHQRLPGDWAVLCYDAVQILAQTAAQTGSIAPDVLRRALPGSWFDTCRGRLQMRGIDHQLLCPSYLGVIADDPAYPFPIYHDLQILSGADCARSVAEIERLEQR